MYKKLIKMFVSKNIVKFFTIIFCISLSLFGFLVSDNFAKNTQTLIWNESKPILWWDIRFESSKELSSEQLNFLQNLEQENKVVISKKIQTYSTIVDNSDNPSLVSLIFVDDKFPLYWVMQVIKKSDNSWVIVSQNVEDLFVKNNSIEIYWKKYEISWIITKFPETWVNFYDDGKKVVLDLQEFDKLKLDEFWAKIDREYLIKINNPLNFEEILSSINDNQLFEWINVTDYKKWWNRFSELFSELDKFIKYVLIVSFILTILIIFLSVESFYIWNKKNFSIIKILWFSDKNLLIFNILLFVFIFVFCFLLSIFLSEFVFYFLRKIEIFQSFYLNNTSIFKTAVLWITILFISVFLPLIKFFSFSPLAWLKENFLQVYTKKEIFIESLLVIFACIFIYNLIIWNFLSSIYFTSILFFFVVFLWYLLNILLKYLYNKFSYFKDKNFSIYDWIRNTVKPWNLSILILFAYVISFSSLLFISIISLNFIDKLNVDLRNNNNIYVINITQKDLSSIDEKFKNQTFSIILWRILWINDKTLNEHLWWQQKETEWFWQFTREFNMTDNELSDLKIIKWWKIKKWEVSVDDEFSKSLNVDIWDKIQFLIYWKKIDLVVWNIRESKRTSINPFFYFQVYKDDFINFPKTYFLSTYIESSDIKQFKKDFLSKTGNQISFIDVEEILNEIKSISKKVFIVIQTLFVYIFIFCIISLVISIVFLIPFKKNKSKIYNILWANNEFIKQNNFSEYIYLQSIAFIFSIIIATIWSYYILNISDFLSFSMYNYFISVLIILVIYIFLLLIIKYLVWKILK